MVNRNQILQQGVIGLVVKFSVAIRAASGSPGFDSQITHCFLTFLPISFIDSTGRIVFLFATRCSLAPSSNAVPVTADCTDHVTCNKPKRDWFSGKILRCHSSNVGEPWVRFPDHALL
ncbi:hypothetical protein B0J15DRAFT_482875, partial [Fusarium solani]